MSCIVWLASYPKSGSTWFRALLANLSRDRTVPAPLDELGGLLASSRVWFDWATGLEASDLTHAEVDALRPRVYEQSACPSADDEPRFLKIHDAFVRPEHQGPVIAPTVTRGAIYLVRNPLDVCVSYAHHSSWSMDESIATLRNERHALADRDDQLQNQLRQHLSSWSTHARSWLDNGMIPVHVVRYEDLVNDPVGTLTDAIVFAGLDRERHAIERAVEWSRFERLQALEQDTGFRERPHGLDRFFRRGQVGAWRDELTAVQARQVLDDHRAMMERFGYPLAL